MSGKFGLASGKNQGNVREFCFVHPVSISLPEDCYASNCGNLSKNYDPLTYVRISFLLNIPRMNGWNLTKFCIHLIIDEI